MVDTVIQLSLLILLLLLLVS